MERSRRRAFSATVSTAAGIPLFSGRGIPTPHNHGSAFSWPPPVAFFHRTADLHAPRRVLSGKLVTHQTLAASERARPRPSGLQRNSAQGRNRAGTTSPEATHEGPQKRPHDPSPGPKNRVQQSPSARQSSAPSAHQGAAANTGSPATTSPARSPQQGASVKHTNISNQPDSRLNSHSHLSRPLFCMSPGVRLC